MTTRSLGIWPGKPFATLALGVALVVGGWEAYTVLHVGTAVGDAAVPPEIVPVAAKPVAITAIARLEPKDGLRRVAGPSKPSAVIGKLLVEEGNTVSTGQVIAVLDDAAVLESRVTRLQARLANAEAEDARHEKLFREHSVSASERDSWRMRVEMGKADVRSAQAELDLATVRSPINGQVVKIHARTGERVGADGIAEIGATEQMYAVAEVYETDVPKVHVGQRATVTSPAFATPLHGMVERVGLKVAKQDVLHTDPAAQTDARVVEVKVRLDDGRQVAGLTNLEATVSITP